MMLIEFKFLIIGWLKNSISYKKYLSIKTKEKGFILMLKFNLYACTIGGQYGNHYNTHNLCFEKKKLIWLKI
jgi:hypothetical protein